MPAARRLLTTALLAGLALMASAGPATAQSLPLPVEDAGFAPQPTEQLGVADPPQVVTPEVPDVTIDVQGDAGLSRTVVIILLLTVGAVAPGILLLMTSFTRFVIVLGLTRNAIGVQTIPPSQVLIGLALFLTFFVMGPVLTEVNDAAVQPLLAGEMGQEEAVQAGFEPVREFMLGQVRDDDLELFMSLADAPKPATAADVPAATLIPAFVVSELRTAFVIGFVIFVPFLVIDLIVSAVLMSLGMVMLPPVFISLPLKLLLFVLVDGWALIVGSMVGSVTGVAA